MAAQEAQEAPGGPTRRPREAPGGPGRPQEAPKRRRRPQEAQEAPGGAQEAPEGAHQRGAEHEAENSTAAGCEQLPALAKRIDTAARLVRELFLTAACIC